MAAKKSSQIASVRSEYASAKREYKALGKKTMGKPKNSPVRREYAAAKRAYKTVGAKLGRLTGRKPKR
jgi:hypothetical protein